MILMEARAKFVIWLFYFMPSLYGSIFLINEIPGTVTTLVSFKTSDSLLPEDRATGNPPRNASQNSPRSAGATTLQVSFSNS
ncbi:hypothetical protein M434DRAFT_99229 [Hypoxylon sp. CO27-5]|nr:hypothetical protein M434DRAFT_99229 [Hypoxylon sp. CO27-5]